MLLLRRLLMMSPCDHCQLTEDTENDPCIHCEFSKALIRVSELEEQIDGVREELSARPPQDYRDTYDAWEVMRRMVAL